MMNLTNAQQIKKIENMVKEDYMLRDMSDNVVKDFCNDNIIVTPYFVVIRKDFMKKVKRESSRKTGKGIALLSGKNNVDYGFAVKAVSNYAENRKDEISNWNFNFKVWRSIINSLKNADFPELDEDENETLRRDYKDYKMNITYPFYFGGGNKGNMINSYYVEMMNNAMGGNTKLSFGDSKSSPLILENKEYIGICMGLRQCYADEFWFRYCLKKYEEKVK